MILERVTTEFVERHAPGVLDQLDAVSVDTDEALTVQSWLRKTKPKQAIFSWLYGDLLSEREGLRILDIGGGLTGFTRLLAARHNYTLIDILAHDDQATGDAIFADNPHSALIARDWMEVLEEDTEQQWDIVTANDLFPNVDQRLLPFLRRIRRHAPDIRMSLTYHPEERWYVTRRIDADEILTHSVWTPDMLELALSRLPLSDAHRSEISAPHASPYGNDRSVCVMRAHANELAEV